MLEEIVNKPEPVPELLSEMVAQAQQLCGSIEKGEESENALQLYAGKLKHESESISITLDGLEDAASVEKDMYFDLTQLLVQKKSIRRPAFAEGIMAYLEAMLVYLLPLRLHDAQFVFMVVDQILNNRSPLWNKNSIHDDTGKWRNHTPCEYLNGIALREQRRALNKEQIEYTSVEGMHWRDAFQPGQYIDQLSREEVTDETRTTNSCEISGWKRAKITNVQQLDEDEEEAADRKAEGGPITKLKLYFQYVGENQVTYSLSDSNSPLIAPAGFYTPGFDQKREFLQPDFVSDVCDEQRNWYRATIIERRPCEGSGIDCDGNPIEEVEIGLRWYDDDGPCDDGKGGRKYYGYGKDLDITRKVSLPSIQLAGTMVKPYTNQTAMTTLNSHKQRHNDEEEQIFTLLDPKSIRQYTVFREDAVIKQSNIEWNEKSKKTKNEFHYTSLVAKQAKKFDRFVFIIDNLNNFGKRGGFERILQLICSYNDPKAKLDIDNLIGLLSFVLKTSWHYHRQFANYFIREFQLAFSGCLKQRPNMTTVQADQLKIYYTHILARYMVPELVDRCVMVDFSTGVFENWESENLERKVQALKLLTANIKTTLELDSESARKVLVAQIDKLNLFSLLYTRENHHSQLCSRSQLVFDFHVKCQKIGNVQLDMLWELVLMEEAAKHDIYHLLIHGKYYLDHTLIDYFFHKFETLPPVKVTIHDLKFLFEMAHKNSQYAGPKEIAAAALWQIATLQKQGYQRSIYESARSFLLSLLKTLDQYQLEYYAEQCCETLAGESIASSVQVLLILKELIQAHPGKSQLVDTLTEQSKIKEILFGELTSYMAVPKEGLDEGNVATFELGHDKFTHKTNLETRISMLLFIQKVGKTAYEITPQELLLMYQNLMERLIFDSEMFYLWFSPILGNGMWIEATTVVDFFNDKFLTNSSLVDDVSPAGFTCISQMLLMVNEHQANITIIEEVDKSKKGQVDFVLNVAPSQLAGISLVWEMYEHSDLQEVIEFLGKLHYRSSRPEVHNAFIDECFARMKANNRLVGQTMQMWRNFFIETEKKGSAKIRTHQTLCTDPYMIHNLVLIPQTVYGSAKYLVLNVESTMTVYELIALAGSHFNKSPLKMYLHRKRTTGTIGSKHFCITLGDLKIEDNEEFLIRGIFKQSKRASLIKNQHLTKRAVQVFKHRFSVYQIESIMSAPQIAQYLRDVNPNNTEDADDLHVFQLLETCGQNDHLKEEDFLQYYLQLCLSEAETAWDHIKVFGLGEDLFPLVNGAKENCLADLPRAFIANNMTQLCDLFALGDTSEIVWRTISSLKTNTELYGAVLANDSELLNNLAQMPLYQLLYCLQLIKYLMKRVLDTKEHADVATYLEKDEVLDEKADKKEAAVDEEATQETKDQKIIREWQGDIKKEPIEQEAFPPEEQERIVLRAKEFLGQDLTFEALHERWFVDFLQKKGLNALINMLQVKKTLNSAESSCIHLIAYLVKVILVGCFLHNDSGKDTGKNLLRRMSSTTSDRAEQQKDEKKYRADNLNEIVKILENDEDIGLSHDILENLNKEQLLTQLQNSLEIMVTEEKPSQDHIGIVKECLNIWTSFITQNPHLLEGLYKNGAHFVRILIDQGLMGKNKEMRIEFREALLFVCINVKKQQLLELPAIFFLKVLLDKLISVVQNVHPKNTKQYFQLLHLLMLSYFQETVAADSESFKEKELLFQVFEHLFNYQSHEDKTNTQECDNTLMGLITAATALLKGVHNKNPEVIMGNDAKKITNVILDRLLFGEAVSVEDLSLIKSPEQLKIFDKTAFKCHNENSREAAYNLYLFVVDKFLSHNELDITYWMNLVLQMEKPRDKKSFDARAMTRADNGFAGLINLGATCYMNSMIQQLYNIPIFRYTMMNADDKTAAQMVEHEGRLIDDNFLHQTQRLFTTLEQTDRVAYNTRDYCFSYKDGKDPVDVRVQQDTSEFLVNKFDRLEEKLKLSQGDKYLFQNVFQGETTSLKVCGGCGNRTEDHATFFHQSIQIKQKASIQEGLENNCKAEIIADYKCDACDQKVELTRKSVIKTLPNTLIIHLNRIVFDMDQLTEIKVNDKCEFPTNLNMRPYMYDQVLKKDQDQQTGEPQEENKDDNDTDFEYKLVGILIHMGEAQAGHYVSYLNVDSKKQKWYEFNDSIVKDFNFKANCASHCFGGTMLKHFDDDDSPIEVENNHNAYILVYEKTIQRPFKIDIEKELVQKVQQDIQVDLPACFNLYPGLFEQVQKGQLHQNKDNDWYALVDQTIFNRIVPLQQQMDALFDNQNFLIEKQVFACSFIKTATTLFERVICGLEERASSGHDVNEQCFAMYKILDHLIFELMVHTRNPSSLVQLTDQMLRVAFSNADSMSKLIDGRIFVPAPKLEKDEKNFFEVWVYHRQPQIRQMTSDILQHVFARAYIRKDVNMCNAISDAVLDLMRDGGECQKALWKLNEYFDFFEKLMIEDPSSNLSFITADVRKDIIMYFNIKKLVPLVIGLIGKASALESGGGAFKKALRVIVHLVEQQPFMAYDYAKDIESGEEQPSADEVMAWIKLDPKIVSPKFTGILDQVGKSSFLDPKSLQVLFLDGDSPSRKWLDVLLRDTAYVNDLSTLVGHLCWRNLEFSQRAGKVILKACNKQNMADLFAPVICTQEYLSIEDQFQRNRIEWILGLPHFACIGGQNGPEWIVCGCQTIDKIKDQVFNYKSNLVKPFGPDSFLQGIYANKDFYNDAALAMLEGLIHTCAERDPSSIILKHLLTVDGPAVNCRRYWDWIEPHCTAKVSYKFTIPEKQQSYMQILANIKKLRQEKAELFRDPDEVRELLEEGGNRLGEPYLVWKNEAVREVLSQKLDHYEVKVVVSELTTTVSESVPNGVTNECLEEIQYIKQINATSKRYVSEVHRIPTQPVKDAEEDEEVHEEKEDRQAATVLCIFVENNDRCQTQQVLIRWNQDLRDQLNFRLPYNDLSANVIFSTRKQVASFTKVRLDQDWGPIEELFSVEVRDPDGEKHQKQMRRQAYQELEKRAEENEPTAEEPWADTQEEPWEPEPWANEQQEQPEEATPVTCQVCTFENDGNDLRCAMCESEL